MSWSVYEYAGTVQVVPNNDLKKHSLDDCFCKPTYKDGVHIHHSLDGREALENIKPS